MRRRWTVLIALAAVATIAVLVVPDFVYALYRGAQKRTMGDMRSVATALESYSIPNGAYPVASSIAELAPLLEPTYTKALPREDGWGRPIEVQSDGTSYALASRGGDGLWAAASLPRQPHGGFLGMPVSEIVRGWCR